MTEEIVLTGITTTGTPHLGNYAGAILPAIAASRRELVKNYYFLADLHGLIKCQDPERVRQSTLDIAATWLAAGLDPEQVIFYRQSDVPEISELTWLLTCVTAKGLMNRAHAYKAAVAANEDEQNDPDKGITMGLYSYPILMAADILMFNAARVPVGRDQIQHIEMARDIAARFNHLYGRHFRLPEALVGEDSALLPGLDGRKMSKSYDNVIPVFAPEKRLRKLIMKIQTDSSPPDAPKDPETSTLFQIYSAFASADQIESIRQQYRQGIAWGGMKQHLFEHLNGLLSESRERYQQLISQPGQIEDILQAGAEKARADCRPFLTRLKEAVGIRSLR